MKVFLDTEFTSLERPQLLSIGMVSEVGLECYIELDLESEIGQKRIAVATQFVLTNVLSQWGRERIESNVTEHLGFAAANWLERMAEHVNDNIELIYADKVDADLVEESLMSAGARWSRIAPRLQWSIVSHLQGEQVVSDAMNASWALSLERQGIGRHHALADARALRAAFIAMHGVDAEKKALQPRFVADAARKQPVGNSHNILTALVEAQQYFSVVRPGFQSTELMQSVHALADGVLMLVSESGELGANPTSKLQELRLLAEKVRDA